ncbi:nucleotidyl transferase AbiEii/AbiGii toxin family protein, partial [Candidatus Micrarchaeota archaeon]|nr:nucleotidyl transferase AbiEii/AbiGii toxin family protein [Candidatus Micrarchaeota archaeon]
MKIPLLNQLKKRIHIDLAALQDEVAEIVYELEPTAVLHGGTAIWRCYGGNRFSEDLDFYSKSERLVHELEAKVISHHLVLTKFKKTDNVIFSKISNGTVDVRLEISLRLPNKKIAAEYVRLDGTFMSVLTISPEDLIM